MRRRPRSIEFRPETPADEPFLRALYASTRAEEIAAAAWDEAKMHQFLQMQFEAQAKHYRAHYPQTEFLVIEDGGEPIGRLYVERQAGSLHVLDIALVPERRGAGLGTAMLRELMDEAAESGGKICLYVEIFNPAQRLYARLGFRRAEDQGVYWLLEWRAGSGGDPA